MKYTPFFIALLYMPLMAQTDLAQMEVVGTPILSETEILAKRLPDGRFCAGIKVISDLEGFSYDSYLGVAGMKDMLGQDIIYVDPAERVLLLFHVGYEPLKIILSEFGIQLQERQMWEIRVKGGKVDILPVSFILTPKDAEVIIDGKKMGNGPTFQMNAGEHGIKISKEDYQTVEDTIVVDPDRVLFQYKLFFKPDMILVQGGTFEMGDTFGEGRDDEKPVHTVTVNSFYISKYEVTFLEYDAFCDAEERDKPNDQGWGRDFHPVINVSWYNAVEYCNWLSKKEGLTECYTIEKTRKDPNNLYNRDQLKWIVECDFSANGYRLPTEAEWEYACRGGHKAVQYKYSGSNNMDEVAWDNNESETHPVGMKKNNELGIYDMSGNVSEWCWDWYYSNYYSKKPRVNPKGPLSGSHRVIRGGDIFGDYGHCCSNRSCYSTYIGIFFTGFRICMNAMGK